MNLSFQLYSARNFKPWSRVIELLAQLGYSAVEGFGDVYEDAQAFRALLDRGQMSMPSGHFALEMLEGDFDRAAEICATLGIGAVYCPYIAAQDRPGDAEGWLGLAARLAAIAEKASEAGLAFGWHNHDFEFVPLPDDEIPMALLFDNAPAIGWEADIAWIVRSGSDPFDWIRRYGDRISAVHVKDIAPAGDCVDEDGWADVGHGTMPWKELLQAIREFAPEPLLIVEHDNPGDLARFARRSCESIRRFEA